MQIDWWTLGIQTVNFFVIVWLLSRFLYRPVRRMIEEREAADKRLSDAADARAEAAETARLDYEKKLADFAAAQREKEAELHSAMEAERDSVLKQAQEKAEALIADSRARLDRDREETLKGLRQEIAALASDLARKALVTDMSAEGDLRRVMGYLDSLPAQDVADLRADSAAADSAVRVVTAAPLDEERQKAWRAALSERLGEGAAVVFDADTALIGGVRLELPHAALDMSVDQRLRDAAREAMA